MKNTTTGHFYIWSH